MAKKRSPQAQAAIDKKKTEILDKLEEARAKAAQAKDDQGSETEESLSPQELVSEESLAEVLRKRATKKHVLYARRLAHRAWDRAGKRLDAAERTFKHLYGTGRFGITQDAYDAALPIANEYFEYWAKSNGDPDSVYPDDPYVSLIAG